MNLNKKDSKDGFRIPEGYFDTLEKRILQSVSVHRNIPEEESFEVPYDYMEKLEERILKAVKVQDEKPSTTQPRVFRLKRALYSVSATAAALLILLYAFPGIRSSFSPDNDYAMANLKPEDVEFYIDNHIFPVYTEDITAVFDSSDLNSVSFSSIDEDELIDYLEENMIDYPEIHFTP